MSELLDKMVKADVLVLATPVYFYSMDGKLWKEHCAGCTSMATSKRHRMYSEECEKRADGGEL